MNNFDMELKEKMFEAVGYRCGLNVLKQADAAHHIKPNTKANRKRFPLFLQSPFNMLPVNNGEHLTKPLPKPPSDLVCDVYESWLAENKFYKKQMLQELIENGWKKEDISG